MIDVLVTAGGIPSQGDPLYQQCQGSPKAIIEIAGKPMIQWVLDALAQANTVNNLVIVGLPEEVNVSYPKLYTTLPDQKNMLANIRKGVEAILDINPSARQVLIVSSDIPTITGEMVDWVVNQAELSDDDICYNVITRDVMEKCFPTSKRSYTKLRDVSVCGGDMNVVKAKTVANNDQLWERIISTRKNVFKQAALLGYDTLILLLFRLITLEDGVRMVTKRLNITGRALICPYAEVGMDVDKPHQLEIVRQFLFNR
jgi:GTP:adenosylcobinamide-phosphate guanylyltransferase